MRRASPPCAASLLHRYDFIVAGRLAIDKKATPRSYAGSRPGNPKPSRNAQDQALAARGFSGRLKPYCRKDEKPERGKSLGPDDYPYFSLGNLLRRWRTASYRSLSEFFAACKLSLSQSDYADYEAGRLLPPPSALDEIARSLGQDAREALLVWAQVQMTSPEHKMFFSRQAFQLEKGATPTSLAPSAQPLNPIQSNQIPNSEFANTWVFGAFEREQLSKYPWLMTFLVGLATVYPAEAPYSAYKFHSNQERDIFVERYLKTWVSKNHLVATATGFQLIQPYLHVPKTVEWQGVRNTFLGNVLEALIPMMTPELIAAKKSHRTHIHKILTDQQRDYWINRLSELEMEFSLSLPAAANETNSARTYSLMVLMAPRELGLPGHITKSTKKFNSAA
ncbi:MAG: helix-turn-helix domain-containing protein [Deltaproteobacteria bacterium]|nr:helix-turn-helix domain-containing protein [Deltaproteobacteria bacterium]